jgi:hypothetical protein
MGRHEKIEFRRAGGISYNLFDRQMGKEKAVDVDLGTDMLDLREIYDVAVKSCLAIRIMFRRYEKLKTKVSMWSTFRFSPGTAKYYLGPRDD